ncbi:MAG: glycosyltransferase family 4 protein [Bacteroidota bacterium]
MSSPLADCRLAFAYVGDVTGSSRALRQFAALTEAGAHIDVLAFETARADVLSVGVRLHALPRPDGGGPRFFWAAHRQFVQAARDLTASARIDLWHASDLYTLPAMARAARRTNRPLVFDSRELYAHLDATEDAPLKRWLWTTIERRHIQQADLVLTVNDAIADRLAAAYGIARPMVQHNLPPVRTVARTTRLRDELGIPETTPILLYQGLLRVGRGLPQTLDALRDVPNVALVVIGEGPFEDEARRLAAPLRFPDGGARVRFVPFTPPDVLPSYTASADVGLVLIESRTESLRLSLPNKLFEYLAAGLPVVASALPKLGRVVDEYGVGLTVDVNDRTALVDALQHIAHDATLRRKALAAIPRVFDEFDWEREKAAFVDVYARLTAPGAPT